MFKLNLKIKKVITLGLITCIIFMSVSIPPKKSEAALATTFQQEAQRLQDWAKWAWDQKNWLADQLIRAAADRILKELTKSIVEWIDSGFEGGPSFLTNTKQFLQDTADIAIGDMLKGSDLAFLCDPFKIQVKLSLGLQYQPFHETISCSFTSALANTEGAMNDFMKGDFINGGGWDSWLQITTVPQNNQMGAMILAQSELDARIAENAAVAKMEIDWGSGFMSYNECTNIDTGKVVSRGTNVRSKVSTAKPGDKTAQVQQFRTQQSQQGGSGSVEYNWDGSLKKAEEIVCRTQTPGGTIANKLNWSDSSVIRKTELANSFDAIFNALVNQVIQGMIKGIGGQVSPKPSNVRSDNLYELNRLAQEANNLKSGGGSGNINFGATYNTTYNNTAPNTSFTPEAFTQRNETIRLIDIQTNLENEFLTAQNNIYNLLFNTQSIFINSSCASTTKNNIISEINGNFVGTTTLPWSIKDSTEISNLTTNNLQRLNSIRDSVANVTSDLMVPIIAGQLSDMSWHDRQSITNISQGSDAFEAIIDWVEEKINDNEDCVGDISALSEWGIE
jgi:hypothetical protein